MSETFPQKVERLEHQPAIGMGHQEKLLQAQKEALANEAKNEKDPAVAIQEALGAVSQAEQSETPPDPMERLRATEAAAAPAAPTHINNALKKITAQRGVKQIQRHESAPERALSRLIHQPAVRVVSEAAGKTVSRPSGLLGGGLLALMGTSIYLYIARHQGFEYNYFVFFILFSGGFVLGLVLEAAVALALRTRR